MVSCLPCKVGRMALASFGKNALTCIGALESYILYVEIGLHMYKNVITCKYYIFCPNNICGCTHCIVSDGSKFFLPEKKTTKFHLKSVNIL